MVNFVITPQDVLGLVVLAIFAAIFLPLILFISLRDAWKKFRKWQATGFCKHDWRIHSTLDASQKHWYKCEKCGERSLR